jgi:hypothetical protein
MAHRSWKATPVAVVAVALLIGCWVGIAQASGGSARNARATVATTTTTAANRPRLLKEDFSARFGVRPATLDPTGDGSIVIGQLGKRGHHIRWHAWNNVGALGLATVWVDNGIPTVAQGTFQGFGGALHAFRARHGRFTRLTVHYRRAGKIKTLSLALEHLGTPGWTWRKR